jgi:hypothetical protein
MQDDEVTETKLEEPETPAEPQDDKPAAKGLNISWTASESIDHERGALWYIVIVALAIAAVGLSWWLLDGLFSKISSTILAATIFAAVFTVSRRPARELHYVLNNEGLTIEDRQYPFSDFRAFGVHQDGTLWQLTLIPIKRFGLSVTMFIHDDQGEEIVDALGARLPMEEVKSDWIDKAVNKLKM